MNNGIFSGISLGNMLAAGGTLNYQEFLTSGVFYPPAKLLAKGGKVFIELRGGGGGGGGGSTSNIGGGGGGGGSSRHLGIVTIPDMSPITVTIGAGGAGGTSAASGLTGTNGTSSSFGSLLTVLGGKAGVGLADTGYVINPGGRGEGNNGVSGQAGFVIYQGAALSWVNAHGGDGGGLGAGVGNYGGNGSTGTVYMNAIANSGGGGGGGTGNNNGGTGGSGYCLIWWFE